MKTKLLLSLIALLFVTTTSFGQGFTKPAEGKSVIYFVQTAVGFGHTMLFDGQDFIGKCQGRSYIRHEIDPGSYTFMALKGANKEFLVTELAADKIYIVSIREIERLGGYSPHFVKVDPSKPKFAKRVLSLVDGEAPSEKDLEFEKKMEKRWKKYNTKAYAKFKSKHKAKNKHLTITKDMFYTK